MRQCLPFVDGHMVGLVAFNEVLRFVFRGMVHIAFDADVGHDFLDDDAANPSGFCSSTQRGHRA